MDDRNSAIIIRRGNAAVFPSYFCYDKDERVGLVDGVNHVCSCCLFKFVYLDEYVI